MISVDTILKELRFSPSIDRAVRDRLTDPRLPDLSATAFEGKGRDIRIRQYDPLTRLTLLCLLLIGAYEGYREKQVDDSIIFF